MKRLVQNQFRRRILFSFLAVVIGFLILNGYLRYQKARSDLITEYTLDITYHFPSIFNEMVSSNYIMPLQKGNKSQYYSSSSKDITIVICDNNDNLLWDSMQKGPPSHVENICIDLPKDENKPVLIEKPSGAAFISHSMSIESNNDLPPRRVILLSRMEDKISRLHTLKLQLAIAYTTLILIAILGVLWGYKRSFYPLNRLHNELKNIKDSEQEKLIYSYPEELEPIAKTINRLLEQQDEQSNKYKKAMDDLAHSLKTRIATCDALLYQKKPPIADIMEQLNDMDSVIQHQLKRALMGSRGISKHHTLLSPIVDKLTKMFIKIHKDRQIEFICNYNNTQTLPINYNDLMEVLGNILENSYRFANSYIILSIVERSEGFNIHIENDGEPLPQDKIESVFQRGIRADEKNPGTGIGLAVCEEIISSYNGQIWFHTQDTGSRLEIFLPHQI
ncbi:GHKL domain-containing protein [Aliivibrio fischeri]|uniref:ATP-binding protein n=1 Tax=Aliivibrio fischeri TaxID=668 RepID=UPI0012D8C537|nr:ATP-binding protein [Aliivibrio fischeri]MUK63415.1 GHKL domain-containing protein [Aliivibrio fischeri]MUK70487.1 GHKL domain-containing protein [Aliivibrio fischeri]MUK73907.1 GHKL domain-containing protein [Aliivibrio fischeri]MUK77255.1 GHKL domain-containing protein [Aliivibrio fischeri]MUL21128.1 GHKL domain-containing protein [Aliivibrio fischeri]